MTTEFKVGDRVRHAKFGAGTVVESLCDDEPKGMVCVHFETWDKYDGEDDYHSIRDVALWRDPPPDTRRRLREYTDLADGDVVVIAGVDWGVEQSRHLAMLNRGALRVSALGDAFRDMLVDEVRRKPRMKKRLVYEEIEKAEAMIGDILIAEGEIPYVYDGYESDLDGRGIFRFVEETEVPR